MRKKHILKKYGGNYMTSLQDILKLDFSYLETFTTRTNTIWGTLFCNENQPTYLDRSLG